MAQPDAVDHARPGAMFDREAEWEALVAFACDPRPGPALGVVSGRLRQGKTYLLEALTRAVGGFYFGAQEATEAESLRRLGEDLARRTGASSPVPLPRWEDAVDALLALGDREPLPVVLDEFPDLVRQSPALPSVVEGAYHRVRRERPHNRSRLLLCGSAVSVMSRLFNRPSPLHGLAGLELAVHTLDFRRAARLWGIEDPRLALLVHAVVGGTPAYRYDYACEEAPSGPEDFDAWVCRTVLNPRTPLFREARHLLQEEMDHWDRALCHSAMTAVTSGCSTRGEIAERLDRPLPDVSHALVVLQDCGLLCGEPDAFRPALTRYRITEPLLAFEHAVAAPHRSALEQEDAVGVWKRARAVFDSAVAGPHFAQVCRDWAAGFAAPETFGAAPGAVSCGSLTDPEQHARLDAEVVLRAGAGTRRGALLSVGRTCWDEVMDVRHLERIRRLLARLADRGEDVGRARPACYGGAGFTPELRAAGERGEVVLVDLDRLYRGS
ncbi:ATP-binding protein [Streptomyces sp. NPDC059506]|uniref:AAA family ATPase n=1 Tax=Streptomyces sp. NPDC059506 TaxID=3347751 RepID=UPI003691EB48